MSEDRPTPDATEPTPPASAPDAARRDAGRAPEGAVPEEVRVSDDDAWATACAEDLAREKARRRAAQGRPDGTAADELRKLVDAVADKLSGIQSPLIGGVAGAAAQQVVRQVVQQAKAAVEPVIERNPDVFDHLAAAGGELLAAYRSAVQQQEYRWTAGERETTDRGDEGTGPGQRIDLD